MSLSEKNCNKLPQKIILSVLSELLDQLAILRHINGWDLNDQTIVEYKTIEEQCNTIKNDDILQQSKDVVDLVDFRRDCAFIESTVQKAFNEISDKGTFEELAKLAEIVEKLQKEEEEILEDTRRKEEEFANMQNMYYREKLEFRKKIDKIMVQIGNLKDEIEDFEQESDIKQRYLTNWHHSKIEMDNYILTKREKQLQDAIEEKHHDFTKEDRVHLEINNIFSEIDVDYQKQLKKWKQRYEHDHEAISNKIKNLQVQRDEQQEKTAQMVKKYIERQEQIDSYKEYKKEQEKLRKEKEKKDKAATKIQAWWRGEMVRKGLGKYKKRKDKKGKKKTEEKKK
ncbi:dynein regulatory complex protein 9-like [Anthonomus grandis grandis]|uniref:dynein regulatory complex protein 9-like n=1 Tax=Anthonomus grandis grandis TaxID=2921223 RepID=UPI00216648FA|nr:dynein regulatory complex protein 9-like [Anthonomus grandis grandis]